MATSFVEHHVEDRENAAVQALLAQLIDAGQRMPGLQQLDHLVEHARQRHVGQQRRHRGDRGAGLGLDGEAQLGGETHRAQDADRILAVAGLRVADHAQHLLARVGQTAVVVHDHLLLRVVVHRVDGEAAARRVLDLRTPDVVAQHAARGVDHVGLAFQRPLGRLLVALHLLGVVLLEQRPEGRDLDDFMLPAAAVDHVHDAEASADDEGTPELVLDLLGRGVGGHVEVLGATAQQQVAHGAAHDVGLEAGIGQSLDDLDAAFVEQLRIDPVLLDGDLDALDGFALGLDDAADGELRRHVDRAGAPGRCRRRRRGADLRKKHMVPELHRELNGIHALSNRT